MMSASSFGIFAVRPQYWHLSVISFMAFDRALKFQRFFMRRPPIVPAIKATKTRSPQNRAQCMLPWTRHQIRPMMPGMKSIVAAPRNFVIMFSLFYLALTSSPPWMASPWISNSRFKYHTERTKRSIKAEGCVVSISQFLITPSQIADWANC